MWSFSACRISSISNAAVMVSISTVTLIVPMGSPSSSWAATNTAFQRAASS